MEERAGLVAAGGAADPGAGHGPGRLRVAGRYWNGRLTCDPPAHHARGGMIAEIVHVTDPVAYAASLLVIVAACLRAATRAARLDAMQTLRIMEKIPPTMYQPIQAPARLRPV